MKEMVRIALRKAGFELKRIPAPTANPEIDYWKAGRIPWSRGYDQARTRFISEVLGNPSLIEIFQQKHKLPAQFGVAFDERCVEYPWLVAHLQPGVERMLDAGSTLNHTFILDQPVIRQKKLHILTLAPEDDCFWRRGISYLYEDLREIPIRHDYYDVIVCLSTLEHVGFDNTRYSLTNEHREHQREAFLAVMQEFRRILRPGGSLFVSVPFGAYRDFGLFQQFDRQMVGLAVQAFGKKTDITETFYRWTAAGWQVADVADCVHCEFGTWVQSIRYSTDEWASIAPRDPALPAAAGAVACIRFIK